MHYLFDVDGTLTPLGGIIDIDFNRWFSSWCKDRSVFLISGSDNNKTRYQLGTDVCETVSGVYNCLGNAYYTKGLLQSGKEFALSSEQKTYLEGLLAASEYKNKVGTHIETRFGAVRFSIVGLAANNDQRKDYMVWDARRQERSALASQIMQQFPDLVVEKSGTTGIDIHPVGNDRSQVADLLDGVFVFFTDQGHQGGTDYTLAQRAQTVHQVGGWRETWDILKAQYAD
jgi:hypothetical protein